MFVNPVRGLLARIPGAEVGVHGAHALVERRGVGLTASLDVGHALAVSDFILAAGRFQLLHDQGVVLVAPGAELRIEFIHALAPGGIGAEAGAKGNEDPLGFLAALRREFNPGAFRGEAAEDLANGPGHGIRDPGEDVGDAEGEEALAAVGPAEFREERFALHLALSAAGADKVDDALAAGGKVLFDGGVGPEGSDGSAGEFAGEQDLLEIVGSAAGSGDFAAALLGGGHEALHHHGVAGGAPGVHREGGVPNGAVGRRQRQAEGLHFRGAGEGTLPERAAFGFPAAGDEHAEGFGGGDIALVVVKADAFEEEVVTAFDRSRRGGLGGRIRELALRVEGRATGENGQADEENSDAPTHGPRL